MKNSKLIAFSGGCLSGKTTAMMELKKELEPIYKVKVLGELMRKQGFASIDEIRRWPIEYLNLQCKVTPEKIAQEREAYYLDYDYVLIDRSIVDSYFYLLFYTDKSSYTLKEWQKFRELTQAIENHIAWSTTHYHKVLFFEPLDVTCEDKVFRPENIDVLKYIESQQIGNLLKVYYSRSRLIRVNNKRGTKEIINSIIDLIL